MIRPRFFRFTILGVALFLISSGLSLAGDPVPGIDISLDEIPGGIVKTAKTDKSGGFTFDKLKPGKYVVKLVPTKVENHNSSRSNKTYPAKGTSDWSVSITLVAAGEKKPFEPIELTIGPEGGKITGRVEREVGIKEEGVK
ncbi:MAG: carboxypeptidase regulatory-like domain-containing protein [Deltaproteobacteria bacterium]|nr:carboxypeptidase regulatory-like domain-containing protein [Deltaproteobacteria bacterium]